MLDAEEEQVDRRAAEEAAEEEAAAAADAERPAQRREPDGAEADREAKEGDLGAGQVLGRLLDRDGHPAGESRPLDWAETSEVRGLLERSGGKRSTAATFR